MHPVEYASTIATGAALVIASYALGGWMLWGIGLAMILLPVLGIPQWLNSRGRPK